MPDWIDACDNEVAGGRSTRKGPDQGRPGRQARSAAGSKELFEACDKYLKAKEATANTTRVVEFDRERLEVVKRHLGDIRLSSITRETIEGFQAKRRVDGASNRTVNMDVGVLRRVLKRFKHWHRLEDDVKMLTESGGAPIGRVLTDEEQERLFEVARESRMDRTCTAPPSSQRTPRCEVSRSSTCAARTSTWTRRRCTSARARTREASECCP